VVAVGGSEPLYEDKIENYTVRFWAEGEWITVEVVDENSGDGITGMHRVRGADAKQLLADPEARVAFARAAIAALSLFRSYHRYTGWTSMFVRRDAKGNYDVKIW
jgi:hypothetical protein